MYQKIKSAVFQLIQPSKGNIISKIFDIFIIILIRANLITIIVETFGLPDDVVIVRKQDDVDNGDIAIMLVNGDEATIKKIQKFNGRINLIPSNTAYEVMTYTNEQVASLPIRCLGKVVELRAKF